MINGDRENLVSRIIEDLKEFRLIRTPLKTINANYQETMVIAKIEWGEWELELKHQYNQDPLIHFLKKYIPKQMKTKKRLINNHRIFAKREFLNFLRKREWYSNNSFNLEMEEELGEIIYKIYIKE